MATKPKKDSHKIPLIQTSCRVVMGPVVAYIVLDYYVGVSSEMTSTGLFLH